MAGLILAIVIVAVALVAYFAMRNNNKSAVKTVAKWTMPVGIVLAVVCVFFGLHMLGGNGTHGYRDGVRSRGRQTVRVGFPLQGAVGNGGYNGQPRAKNHYRYGVFQ